MSKRANDKINILVSSSFFQFARDEFLSNWLEDRSTRRDETPRTKTILSLRARISRIQWGRPIFSLTDDTGEWQSGLWTIFPNPRIPVHAIVRR